jgi:general secretion pathway protein K
MSRRTGGDAERGVALLIALLVTTLLMALVVEFAYGTRVSLRAAINFRDGQRAFYLARSGVSFAGKLLAENLRKGKLQQNLEQREWQVVPIVSGGDTELRIRWEDEGGKINIANVRSGQPSLRRLELLFGLAGVDIAILEPLKGLQDIRLIDELHGVMGDEDFGKIRDHITVYGSNQVDINTAAPQVLQSLGLSASTASLIREKREREPFDTRDKINAFPGMDTTTAGTLDITSNVFRVVSHATVGGYTKQAEAVIRRDAGGFTILYWRLL